MRKCIVKVMTLVICIGIFSVSSITVEANETLRQGNVYGEQVRTKEEYEAYLDNLSAEEIEARNAKLAMAQEVSKTRLTRTVSRLTIPGTFTMYQQQKDYYCIPACIQSILVYINGTSPSQADIAEDLNIYVTTWGNPADMPAYLNDYQEECHYVYVANPSSSVLYDYLYLTIVDLQVPASIGIANTTTNDWFYETSGHSLIVNGIYSDYSAILISDPLGGINGIPYFYEKTADIINSYCTRVVF